MYQRVVDTLRCSASRCVRFFMTPVRVFEARPSSPSERLGGEKNEAAVRTLASTESDPEVVEAIELVGELLS